MLPEVCFALVAPVLTEVLPEDEVLLTALEEVDELEVLRTAPEELEEPEVLRTTPEELEEPEVLRTTPEELDELEVLRTAPEEVVEPVPSPVRRTVWPELEDVDELELTLAAELVVPLLAAGVVVLEVDVDDDEDVTRFCAEASYWKAVRDKAAAAVATKIKILFMTRLFYL